MSIVPGTSLVISSRNRPALLAATVTSVLEGDQIPGEIVIVDQSETPHPARLAWAAEQSCSIRYVHSDSVGLSRGRNLGMWAATHEVLVFTDDDVFVTSAWFGTLVRALVAGGPQAVVTGRVLPSPSEQQGQFVPSTITSTKPAVYKGRVGRDVLFPQNMAMYRSILDSVGPFDERLGAGTNFPASEDNDFGFRLLELGYSIVYVPDAVLYHRAWRSGDEYVPLWWDYGLGQGAFYAKHFRLRDPYGLFLMLDDVRYHGLRSLRNLFRDRRRAFGYGAYVLGVILGAIRWTFSERRATHA